MMNQRMMQILQQQCGAGGVPGIAGGEQQQQMQQQQHQQQLQMQMQQQLPAQTMPNTMGANNWAGGGKGGGKGKEPADQLETKECSTHKKTRGIRYLYDDGNGGVCCGPDALCKTGVNMIRGGQKKTRMCNYIVTGSGCRRAVCTFAHSEAELGTTVEAESKEVIMWETSDWTSPVCSDFQFARNKECRTCNLPKPTAEELAQQNAQQNAQQYSASTTAPPTEAGGLKMLCSKHGVMACVMSLTNDGNGGICCTPGSECDVNAAVGGAQNGGGGGWGAMAQTKGGGGMQEGDWNCPACGDHQFQRNTECRKCGTPKPMQMQMQMQMPGKGARASPY